ncbi:hypothetical protein [Parvibaculum sp.]|uniref:hypothetical protein n=1 Tax=Parvibaculum sp. TaxID=2024848 RepID=UPI001D3F41E6|nr:hypothetical protein [Parvibaculum sp.]MBX3491244.1 hypothetical protein [Parvibaculum sp.]MBX3491258.1 hypothetical protein [Parvibaculum sp.]
MSTPKVASITVSAEHVKEAEARCARQREFIRELRASGQPTATAEAILESMQVCLARVREAAESPKATQADPPGKSKAPAQTDTGRSAGLCILIR